jgi:hypothetical protein
MPTKPLVLGIGATWASKCPLSGATLASMRSSQRLSIVYRCPDGQHTIAKHDSKLERPAITAVACKEKTANSGLCNKFALYLEMRN